ncbi:ABC transporter substrate-binding protein [Streptomyces corynorhini]|uniref:Sugar ABC transporter substrate-binding protein n=1 Tax=Streptomyces corynorhini TaxID=2282652 RepID=A0A370BBG6_9ACTN|nr:sugar ABC transporter substrate-binding protein [Streptomyces corynorhini]RDG39147.1 sugar ABC transporter substrate-binding protein [Streptomyces corynorhini]
MYNTARRRGVRGAGLASVLALALTLTACGGSSDDSGGSDSGSADDVKAALEKGGDLTVWTWDSTIPKVAKDFEAAHPKVKVKVVNAGTSKDEYTALQNAISAGKGVPDVAQIEYFALGQFSLAKSVADLAPYGADKLADSYSPGPWNAVTSDDAVYGLPVDSGPMALYYNKKVFDKYKIAVPTTWDAYVTAAEKLHKADPKVYITADTGEAGFATSLMWQAGGRPYKVDGTDVSIDFGDAGSTTFAKTWQKLLDGKLLAPVTSWTDEWFKGLGDGTIATLATGAWMPTNLQTGAPAAAGDWRVAPLPQWKAGEKSSAESGGSSLAVPAAGKNKALAYAFTEYVAAGAGVKSRVKDGAYPATTADMTSKEFLDTKFDYFGGQEINKVFAQSASEVASDWSYLPFQVYANSIFNDTVGKAYVSGTTLSEGLAAWQKQSRAYGSEQGFTVK